MLASALFCASPLRRYCYCDSSLFACALFFRTFTVVFTCFPFPMSRLVRLGCSFSGRPFNDQHSLCLWPVLLQYVQYFSKLFTFADFSAFDNVNRFAYRLVRQSRPWWLILPHFWHCIPMFRFCRNCSCGRVPLAHIPIAPIHSYRPVLRVFSLDHQSENFILN